MAKVTSTVIVHRPERVLYYLPEISEEATRCIADGVCPAALKEYQYAFGTYDDIGLFYLPQKLQNETGKRRVIGIEYRKDDSALSYPEQLPFVVLPACNVIIQDITYDDDLNQDSMEEIIRYGRTTKNDRSAEYNYVPDGIVSVFTAKEKLRVSFEVELVSESKLFLNRLGSD